MMIKLYIESKGKENRFHSSGSVFEEYVKARNENRKRQRMIIADFKGQQEKMCDSIAKEVVQILNSKLNAYL